MATEAKTKWRMTGEGLVHCNCSWGCPCQFNALPTHGRCDALGGWQIEKGSFGSTSLDGVRFAQLFWFPGPVHEGNGVSQLIVDEKATPQQRTAVGELHKGTQGGAFWEIFAAVTAKQLEHLVAPIHLEIDRKGRKGRLRIPGIAESAAEPIKNPVTGEAHSARIVLPEGFEYKEAEMANSTQWRVKSAAPLSFEYSNTYAQLYEFDWHNG